MGDNHKGAVSSLRRKTTQPDRLEIRPFRAAFSPYCGCLLAVEWLFREAEIDQQAALVIFVASAARR
jgi:hypothetical protein